MSDDERDDLDIEAEEHLKERDERVAELQAQGAVWDEEGQFYSLHDNVYDADGNPM